MVLLRSSWAQKMSTLSIKRISEKLGKLNKSNPLMHMTNDSKKAPHFDFIAMLRVLNSGVEDKTFLLSSLYSFDSIFFRNRLDW